MVGNCNGNKTTPHALISPNTTKYAVIQQWQGDNSQTFWTCWLPIMFWGDKLTYNKRPVSEELPGQIAGLLGKKSGNQYPRCHLLPLCPWERHLTPKTASGAALWLTLCIPPLTECVCVCFGTAKTVYYTDWYLSVFSYIIQALSDPTHTEFCSWLMWT
jgi:hypothetical protein